MTESTETPRTYKWPRYLLAAVILGILISVYAVILEVRRIRSFEYTDPLFINTNATIEMKKEQ